MGYAHDDRLTNAHVGSKEVAGQKNSRRPLMRVYRVGRDERKYGRTRDSSVSLVGIIFRNDLSSSCVY